MSKTTKTQSLFGLGLYTPADVARYIRSDAQKVKRWAAGYTYLHRDQRRASPPVIQTALEQTDNENILTFLDLIELCFVAEFRKHEVSLQTIRTSARRLAEILRMDHPFASCRVATDGMEIFALLEREEITPEGMSREVFVEELRSQAGVFEEFVARFFVPQIEPDENRHFAGRWYPLGKDRRVVLDPARAFGKPIDCETGVPTFVLYESTKSDDSIEAVARYYDVPIEAIEQAVEYEEYLLTA